MAGRPKRKRGHHKDNIDIVTTDVVEQADDIVEKQSSVQVDAIDDQSAGALWVGLKIKAGQKVLALVVDGETWVSEGGPQDADGRDQFKRLFPEPPGEKWAVYFVNHTLKPGSKKFKTMLRLKNRVAKDPDAQVVTIGVCYVAAPPESLSRKDILLGHSLVQAPPELRRLRKRASKRAPARRRTAGRRRSRR